MEKKKSNNSKPAAGLEAQNYKKIALMLLPFLLLAAFSLFFQVYAMDEYTYMNAADAIRTVNPSLVLKGEEGRFPFFPTILAVFTPVFGNDVELTGKILNLTFALLTTLLMYLFARKLFGEETAFWAGLIVSTNPFYAFLYSRILTEPLFIFLLTACVYLVYLSEKNQKWLVAFGACLALLTFTRFIGLYVLPVLLLYFWKNSKLDRLLFSKYTLLSIAAFFAVSIGYLSLASPTPGNPLQFFFDFFTVQLNVRQGSLSLPDKIPSFLLAMPFILAAAFPFFLASAKKNYKQFASDNKFMIFALSIAVISVVMEVWGLFNFRLLRYLVVIAPFAAVLAGAYVVSEKKLFSFDAKKLASLAVIANLVLSAGLIFHVNTHYDKQIAYRDAGQYAVYACRGSVFTNIPAVLIHYSGRPVSYLEEQAASGNPYNCIVISSFDAWTFSNYFDLSKYRKGYSGGVDIYSLPNS